MTILTFRKSLILAGVSVCFALLGLNHIRNSHNRSKRDVDIVYKGAAGRADEPKFTFDDIYNSKFSYKYVSPRWVSNNEYVYQNGSMYIIRRDVETQVETVLMESSFWTDNAASYYKVSADLKYIALLTEYKKGWRHSYNGTYLIYDVDNRMINTTLTIGSDIQYLTWGPVGNALAYVRGFNIYYKAAIDEVALRVTTDGRAEYIFNGIPDWVYEEEMISSNNVIYFSPDGQFLAYAQFDDSMCKHVNYERYDEKKYQVMIDISYPKAGTPQPTNKVFVFNTVTEDVKVVLPPADFMGVDYLFNRVTWASGSRAAVTWCDRLQTNSIMRLIDVNPGNTSITYTDSDTFKYSNADGWLYQRRPYWIPVFGATLGEFYTVRPHNGWQHLYKVNKTAAVPVTSGEYTVTSESASYPSVEFYDPDNGKVYFSATKESPHHRHIYRTNEDDPSQPECITCKYVAQYPGRCDQVTSTSSPDGSYTLIRCGGDGAPLYLEAEINKTSTDVISVLVNEVVLQSNEELEDAIAATDMSTKEYGKFTSETGYDFRYQIWKPKTFDPTKKYPLLIDVYAGPGYQKVAAGWSRSWANRFVPSSLDVIVASVDGRGSCFYGNNFMYDVYRKLGQYEPFDQLEFARHMAEQDYIDETRIAVWGWSYGGYTTSLILGRDAESTIKCGFAVAPLADWRFYDTIYAERYMRLPSTDDNKDGYDLGSVLHVAKNMSSSKYFLIHGTADDNVHFQNAARIEQELVANDIHFNDFFYADQDHSINVGNARKHVYKVLTREVCLCFGLEVPEGVWTP